MNAVNLMLLTIAVGILATTNLKQLARDVSDALSNFRRPGPPMHPLGSDDAWFLTRRRRKTRI